MVFHLGNLKHKVVLRLSLLKNTLKSYDFKMSQVESFTCKIFIKSK